MRYKRFLRQSSRTQKGVLVDLLCSEGPLLKHRLALRISVGARTCSWSDRYLACLLAMQMLLSQTPLTQDSQLLAVGVVTAFG